MSTSEEKKRVESLRAKVWMSCCHKMLLLHHSHFFFFSFPFFTTAPILLELIWAKWHLRGYLWQRHWIRLGRGLWGAGAAHLGRERLPVSARAAASTQWLHCTDWECTNIRTVTVGVGVFTSEHRLSFKDVPDSRSLERLLTPKLRHLCFVPGWAEAFLFVVFLYRCTRVMKCLFPKSSWNIYAV